MDMITRVPRLLHHSRTLTSSRKLNARVNYGHILFCLKMAVAFFMLKRTGCTWDLDCSNIHLHKAWINETPAWRRRVAQGCEKMLLRSCAARGHGEATSVGPQHLSRDAELSNQRHLLLESLALQRVHSAGLSGLKISNTQCMHTVGFCSQRIYFIYERGRPSLYRTTCKAVLVTWI